VVNLFPFYSEERNSERRPCECLSNKTISRPLSNQFAYTHRRMTNAPSRLEHLFLSHANRYFNVAVWSVSIYMPTIFDGFFVESFVAQKETRPRWSVLWRSDRYTPITLRAVVLDNPPKGGSLRFAVFSTQFNTSLRRHTVCHQQSRKCRSVTVTCFQSL
jgi:hypothetical protein